MAQVKGLLAGKADPKRCPGKGVNGDSQPICTDTVRMMPSSRVEVRVLRTDNGAKPSEAVFRTAQYDTGDGDLGDHWPAIDLASITLEPRKAEAPDQVALRGDAREAVSSSGSLSAPAALKVPGTNKTVSAGSDDSEVTTQPTGPVVQPKLTQAGTAAITPQILVGRAPDPNCTPLADGHRRRILFGFPTDSSFGLGYVEVDQNGQEIAATRIPIQRIRSGRADGLRAPAQRPRRQGDLGAREPHL